MRDKMKKKIFGTLILSVLILLPFADMAFANSVNNTDGSGQYYKISTYIEDGLVRYSLDGDGKNKELEKEILEGFLDQEYDYDKETDISNKKIKVNDDQISPSATIFYEHTNSDKVTGKDSRNTNAQVTSYAKAVWTRPKAFDLNLETTGYTKGWWGASNPTHADKFIFNQSYSVSGSNLSISIGWPPSATFNSDKSNGAWQSEPINNVYNHTVSYAKMKANSSVAIYSVTFTDTVDIYVPGNTYRPTASIYLD